MGYCQAMNFIAGILLFHMGEENAFYTFDAMLSDKMYLPPDLFDATLKGLHRNTFILDKLLAKWYGSIAAHFKKIILPTELFTTKWFMKMYLGTFPMETTLRIWDCFFMEGFKVLFRIALAHLHMCEDRIFAEEEMYRVITVVNESAKEMYECEKLMQKSFGIRRFGRSKIQSLGKKFNNNQPPSPKPKSPGRKAEDSSSSCELVTVPSFDDLSSPQLSPAREYIPKVPRREIMRGYDSVVFREAEMYLFDRNRTIRRQKLMKEVTATDRRLEQSYMEYIADAVTKDIDDTEGSSDEEEEKMKTDFKKKFPRKPNSNSAAPIELYRSGSLLFTFDGDVEKLDEMIKVMEGKGKVLEAANALRLAATFMLDTKDDKNAMMFYERSCEAYQKLTMMEKIIEIRLNNVHNPTMSLELFENLAENYEWLKINSKEHTWIFEAFSILLRLGAFLKGDGSEGTYELKERLEEGVISEENSELYDKLTQLLSLIECGNRDDADKMLHAMIYLDFDDENFQAKYQSILNICRKYIQY